jgi:predicted type IV restriction endonuclease
MTTANELRMGLLALAKRSVSIMTACTNIESTKLYLVLPFLGLLGYDFTDPFEVYPDHVADLDPSQKTRIDFAVLRNGTPVIAVACRRAGLDLHDDLGALRRYFDLLPEVKLAILTNGVRFEFYVDAMTPGIMDDEPFLTLDFETIARSGVADENVETLLAATKGEFEPETIAEAAHVALVRRRLRAIFIEEAKAPSDAFCRFALERIGIGSAPKKVIDRHYAQLIKSAFEESVAALSIEQLRSQAGANAGARPATFNHLAQRIGSIERELAVVAHVRRRLAYLVDNESGYGAIDDIRYQDYVGKLVVYLERERKGRLFDYIEGADGFDKFVFPEPHGEIVTNDLSEIDAALKSVFERRLRELGHDDNRQALARRA